MRVHRIGALFVRHIYVLRRSFPRLLEIFYWPTVDLLVWGFLTVYLARYQGGLPGFVSFFIGALIFWDILFRSQSGISVSFLEDVWSKNLLNLFTSPLTPLEYLTSLMLFSTTKLLVTIILLSGLAWVFYAFNLFVIGIALVPFVINLMLLGWTIGIFTVALILRFGQEAEVLAWALGFLFMPLSAVFYPVSVLPPLLRFLARFISSAHVFEGMRQVLSGGGFPLGHLAWATALNAAALLSALLFYRWCFSYIRKRGLLVRLGE